MEIAKILESERIKNARISFRNAFEEYVKNRSKAFEQVDLDALKKRAREIMESSFKRLDEIKKKAVENLTKNGIKVFEAKNAEEARRIALEIIPAGETIAKSKSNAISEIELLKEISGRNELTETDCGDFLVSICEESTSHPVTPAIHLPIEKIVEKIEEKFNIKLEKTPEKIVEWARKYIREKIIAAKVGLTGANFISADGCIVILENEGNISLLSRLPEKHVIIAGIEKLVENIEDAATLCKVSAIWGSGINLPTYINFISSHSKTADVQKKVVRGAQGAKEVYLILLDNGRSQAIEEGLNEIFYCINCGSCLYFCPVYRQIFDNYGLHYFGSIGVAKTSFTNNLTTAVERGLYFCTMCEACKVNCPLGIDVPKIAKKLREMAVNSSLGTDANTKMIENIRTSGNPFGKLENDKIPKELYCC